MEAPTIPTQEVESQTATPAASQASETPEQSSSQTQETSSTKVDRSDSNVSSQDDARKASDFETARHLKSLSRDIRSLIKTIGSSQQSQVSQASVPQVSQITNEELLKDPVSALGRLVDSRLNAFKSEIPQQFQQFAESTKYESARQEALRLIKTNELVKTDPQGVDRIQEILNEEDDYGNSLEKYSVSNPRHAAQLVLQEFKNRFGGVQRSASAPSKAQMQTTATAVHASSNQANLEQEAAQLYRMAMNDPTVMMNPDYKSKLDAFNKRLQLQQASQGV